MRSFLPILLLVIGGTVRDGMASRTAFVCLFGLEGFRLAFGPPAKTVLVVARLVPIAPFSLLVQTQCSSQGAP